jgi:deoxyadenosine/deoxycytidine kinase
VPPTVSLSSGRVELAGGIASGKTTLARLLAKAGLRSVLENFHANPFWKAFYSNPELYSFETEITFLLQHYHSIKEFPRPQEIFVCDFSLLLDRAYAALNLRGRQLRMFQSVCSHVVRELARPRLLIHLRCDPHILLNRIRKRSRSEELSLGIDYVAGLNHAVERQVARAARQTKVVTIDSATRNFAHNERIREQVKAEVLDALDFQKDRVSEAL